MYDLNDPISRYYDFAFAVGTKEETEYYRTIADEVPGPVADLCCGTGILSLEIASPNKKVYAIDQSVSMLANLKAKMKPGEPIEVIQSDMNTFELPEKVVRVICRDAFFHNLTPEDQRKTLVKVRKCLVPGGIFAFNIHVPNPDFLVHAGSEGGKSYAERGKYKIPNSSDTLAISHSMDADYYSQVISTSLKFEVFDQFNKKKSEEYSSWKSRYTFPYEMFYLLEIAGFRVRNAFGDYNRSPWTMKSMLIIEAEKNS